MRPIYQRLNTTPRKCLGHRTRADEIRLLFTLNCRQKLSLIVIRSNHWFCPIGRHAKLCEAYPSRLVEFMNLIIRAPKSADASYIAAIDQAGLATGHASFRSDPYDWPDFEATYLANSGFALVAQKGTNVIAWAGVARVSSRPVYAGVGEVSIYVSPVVMGQGVGKTLLRALVQHSEARGYWTLAASIFPENDASLALHQASGFRIVGRRARIGLMGYGPLGGQWRDTVLMELRSDTTGQAPP